MLTTTLFRKHSKELLERITRWSYVAKGILFFSLGFVLLYEEFGGQAEKPNRKEILELWTFEPLGKVLLLFVAFVFIAHLVWRLFEAWFDPYAKGNSPSGLVYRLTYLLSGISYGALTLAALRLLFTGQGGSNNQKQEYVFRLLHVPGGRWVVLLVGTLLLLWAAVQGYKGLTGSVVQAMKIEHLPQLVRRGIWLCSFVGFLALTVTLGVVGFYLVRAAWQENALLVKNMDDVFLAIDRLPNGSLWLRLEAFALCLFGLFMLTMAWYFPFRTA